MKTWVLADLDNIIRDFMDQLLSATQEGWHRTRPDQYRAVVAALESALRERHVLRVEEAGVRRSWAIPKRRLASYLWPFELRWASRPRLSLVPVSRGR